MFASRAMELMTANVWTLLLCTIILLLVWTMRRPPGLPPGPPLLPLIGNLLSMNADLRLTFRRLRKRYGDIFTVYIFNQPVIVLNGYDVIKDALFKKGDIFSDRPPSFISDHLFKKRGVGFTSGDLWREHRRFSLSTLKDFGMGRPILEDKVREEIVNLLDVIDGEDGKPFNCKRMIQCAVANVICSVAFGKRYEHTDPLFQKLMQCIATLASLGTASILNIFPAVRYIPGDLFSFWKLTKALETIEIECIQPVVEDHLKNYNDNDVNDFISAYIKEMKNSEADGKDTTMDAENLQATVLQLFGAGTETTSTTLCWALIYLVNYPEVQEKCFTEINEVIGLEKAPSMKDVIRLPYIEATIAEVQRCADIVPTSVPHSVPYTVQYKGYTFPKGVTVLPMISSVLHDPDVWGDPQNFRPTRFINDDGKFQKNENLLPYSLVLWSSYFMRDDVNMLSRRVSQNRGSMFTASSLIKYATQGAESCGYLWRRACLGESMARMELFLFLSAMIQRFEFVGGDGGGVSEKSSPGFVYSPPAFRIRAIPRS